MLPPTIDRRLWHIYEMAEQRYLRSLPPEHFTEATTQATQRKITLESFDLIHAKRPEVQIFNELLVQYRRGPDDHKPGQVVPGNMVVVHDEPIAGITRFRNSNWKPRSTKGGCVSGTKANCCPYLAT